MILALFLGSVLGAGYAWTARQHHLAHLCNAGSTTKFSAVFSSILRIGLTAGAIVLMIEVMGASPVYVAVGLLTGNIGTTFWLNWR